MEEEPEIKVNLDWDKITGFLMILTVLILVIIIAYLAVSLNGVITNYNELLPQLESCRQAGIRI